MVVPSSPCETDKAAPSVRACSSSTSIERRRRSLGALSWIVTSTESGADRSARTENSVGGPRRIAPSNASRTISYSAACERSPSTSAAFTSISTRKSCSMPRSSASALIAIARPWSRSTTGSRLNERSRSSPTVVRVRASAFSSTSIACSDRSRSIRSSAASSISATPESDCTGPSWRNSAIRRRSSCSAPRICSVSSRRAGSSTALVDDRVAQRDRDRVRAGVSLELREDMPHVALHRLLADEELRGHVGVGHAVGEKLEDLPLPPGEHVILVLAGEEGRHQGRVDVALAAGDLLDRPQQRLVRRLLEDVALRARLEAAAEEAALAVRREDQHCRLRHLLRQDLRRLEPVHPGHADVHDHHVGPAALRERDGALAVARLADHADVRRARQRQSQAFADDLVVVDDQTGDLLR